MRAGSNRKCWGLLLAKKKKRATGFEPATPSLGSSYSTTELCPLFLTVLQKPTVRDDENLAEFQLIVKYFQFKDTS